MEGSTRNFLGTQSINLTANYTSHEAPGLAKSAEQILPWLRSKSTFSAYNPAAKLAEENKKINESMKKYSRYNTKYHHADVHHDDIASRFEQINLKINSLLFSYSEIKEIAAQRLTAVTLKAGLQRTYKLRSRSSKAPLRIFLSIAYEPFLLTVYISERVQRPNHVYSDKAFTAKHKRQVLVYWPKESKGGFFESDYIYITVETGCKSVFEIRCCFGNFVPAKQKSVAAKSRMGLNARTFKAEIADQLKRILNNAQLLEECRKQAREVIIKRRLKNNQALRKSFISEEKKLSCSGIAKNFEIRRLLATTKNAEIEENKRLKAFFYTNYWLLSRMYDKSMNRTVTRFHSLKHNIRVIIALVKLFYISRFLSRQFKAHRSLILRKELVRVCHLRIYVFSVAKFALLGRSFKHRVGTRVLV